MIKAHDFNGDEINIGDLVHEVGTSTELIVTDIPQDETLAMEAANPDTEIHVTSCRSNEVMLIK
jgi:hypothetical protein